MTDDVTSTTPELPVLSFADFQKTRRFTSALHKAWCVAEGDCSKNGFVYIPDKDGVGLAIEIMDETVSDEARAQGSYQLVIENHCDLSFDLTRLERQLYEFGLDQYFAAPPLADDRFTMTDEVVEDAINAMCLIVQERIGSTDGGIASLYFSGDEERQDVKEILQAYADCERSYEHPDNETDDSE